MFPPKLTRGSGVRIIAPSCTLPTLNWMTNERLDVAKQWFLDRGIHVSEADHLRDCDEMETASIEDRVADIHAAFADPSVHALMAIRGGWLCNQLLGHLDYELIRSHPKIVCGFSDITALGNAIYAKTGLVTYSGPNFYLFGLGAQMQHSYKKFEQCLMHPDPFTVDQSSIWTNDRYSPEHPLLQFESTDGPWVIRQGSAKGTIIGGNLCTLNLLQGTEYMPSLENSIVCIEDDYESPARTFDRNLQSLLHLPTAKHIRGLVIGRFQKASEITRELLERIIRTKSELGNIPIIANCDFGHTYPLFTFPIGGTMQVTAKGNRAKLEILEH
jgi:muramoyltetrapeptide carboxypeptidase